MRQNLYYEQNLIMYRNKWEGTGKGKNMRISKRVDDKARYAMRVRFQTNVEYHM